LSSLTGGKPPPRGRSPLQSTRAEFPVDRGGEAQVASTASDRLTRSFAPPLADHSQVRDRSVATRGGACKRMAATATGVQASPTRHSTYGPRRFPSAAVRASGMFPARHQGGGPSGQAATSAVTSPPGPRGAVPYHYGVRPRRSGWGSCSEGRPPRRGEERRAGHREGWGSRNRDSRSSPKGPGRAGTSCAKRQRRHGERPEVVDVVSCRGGATAFPDSGQGRRSGKHGDKDGGTRFPAAIEATSTTFSTARDRAAYSAGGGGCATADGYPVVGHALPGFRLLEDNGPLEPGIGGFRVLPPDSPLAPAWPRAR